MGDLNLLADARIGELTRAMEKLDISKNSAKNELPRGKFVSKSSTLATEGISWKQAAECEKVAALADSGAHPLHSGHRRHLSQSQRSMVAESLAKLKRGGDPKTNAQHCALDESSSQDEAAKMLQVSRRNVQKASA